MAKRILIIPGDVVTTILNITFELPTGKIDQRDFNLLKSQMVQMIPNSTFLKSLNENYHRFIDNIQWITVRGLRSDSNLGMIW